jgi:hypothetical protein
VRYASDREVRRVGLWVQRNRCIAGCRIFTDCKKYRSKTSTMCEIIRYFQPPETRSSERHLSTWYDVIDIYLLTASGLPPGGSCTIHIYTQTIHRTTHNKQYIVPHKMTENRQVPVMVEPVCKFLPTAWVFRAFSSVVRQMPGYNSQRRGTAHILPK